MDSKQGKQEEILAPSRTIRLTCWIGIYLAASVFSTYWLTRTANPPLGPLAIAGFMALFLPIHPLGLAFCYGSLISWIFGIVRDSTDQVDLTLFLYGPLAYITYALHFRMTWKAKTRREFLLLMLSLLLFVSAGYALYFFVHVRHR